MDNETNNRLVEMNVRLAEMSEKLNDIFKSIESLGGVVRSGIGEAHERMTGINNKVDWVAKAQGFRIDEQNKAVLQLREDLVGTDRALSHQNDRIGRIENKLTDTRHGGIFSVGSPGRGVVPPEKDFWESGFIEGRNSMIQGPPDELIASILQNRYQRGYLKGLDSVKDELVRWLEEKAFDLETIDQIRGIVEVVKDRVRHS